MMIYMKVQRKTVLMLEPDHLLCALCWEQVKTVSEKASFSCCSYILSLQSLFRIQWNPQLEPVWRHRKVNKQHEHEHRPLRGCLTMIKGKSKLIQANFVQLVDRCWGLSGSGKRWRPALRLVKCFVSSLPLVFVRLPLCNYTSCSAWFSLSRRLFSHLCFISF